MQVSGLQISGTRISLLTLKKQGDVFSVLSFATKELSEGIIEEGILKKPKELTSALIALKKNTKPKKLAGHYVVVGLPEELVYLTVKPFPAIEEDEVRDALELNLREFMPGTSEDIFWGYQLVQAEADGKEALLASVKKNILSDYLRAIAAAKLTPVSVEPSSLAAARAYDGIGSSLIVDVDKKDVLVAAYSDKVVRYGDGFSYDEATFDQKIKKIIGFYKSKKNIEAVDILVSGDISSEQIEKIKKITGENVILGKEKLLLKDEKIHSPVLLGLAIRGLLEQKEDDNLSLLPLGTAEGYEEKRVLHSIGAIANLTTITSVLFIAIFVSFVVLLNYLSLSADQQLSNISNQKVDLQAADAQKQLAAVEPKVAYIKTISKNVYTVGDKIQTVVNAANGNVSIKSLTMAKDTQIIQVTGSASNRDDLSTFKDSLAGDKTFSKVELVSTSVTDATADFTINITIKK